MMNYERFDRYILLDEKLVTRFPTCTIAFPNDRKGKTDYMEFDIINMRLTRCLIDFIVRFMLFFGVIEQCNFGFLYADEDISGE